MDPFTLALAAVGTGTSALSKYLGGVSSKAMAALSGQIAGNNASIANMNADTLNTQADIAHMGIDFSWSKAKTQIARITEQGRQTLASQRSYFAGSNLDPTFGSPLLTQAITAGRVQSDIDLTKADAAIGAADAMTREANIRAQSAGQRGNALSQLFQQAGALMKGDADMTAGMLGAATSFLQFGAFAGKSGLFDGGGGSTFSGNPWGAQNYMVPTAGRDF